MVHDDGNGTSTRLTLERQDYVKAAGVIFGAVASALAIAVPLMMYVFMTRTDADAIHSGMKQEAALEKQEREIRAEYEAKREKEVDEHLKNLDKIVQTTDTNVRRLLWKEDVPAKPLPAGVKAGDEP